MQSMRVSEEKKNDSPPSRSRRYKRAIDDHTFFYLPNIWIGDSSNMNWWGESEKSSEKNEKCIKRSVKFQVENFVCFCFHLIVAEMTHDVEQLSSTYSRNFDLILQLFMLFSWIEWTLMHTQKTFHFVHRLRTGRESAADCVERRQAEVNENFVCHKKQHK